MSHEWGTVAVVGATGAVGRELLTILAARGVDASRLRLVASRAGRIAVGDASCDVVAPDAFDPAGVDVAFLAAGADVSRAIAPRLEEAGAIVIDNSSAFRHDGDVPLLVPGVNDDPMPRARRFANPNCTTTLLVTALDPLRRAFGIAHVDVCTYQAVSGAGSRAIDALRDESRARLDGAPPGATAFDEPCAFNAFSHDSAVDEGTGVNGEERKVIDESRRIWGDPRLGVTPTCVRVPVVRAHLLAVTVTLTAPAPVDAVEAALRGAPALRWRDDRRRNSFPTSLCATGRDRVVVGRLRPDPGAPDSDCDPVRYCLLVAGDQLRTGAALNAVRIADRAVRA